MAFSRLQLAAALLEYDNDSNSSLSPPKLASQSAIFSHNRRTKAPPPLSAPLQYSSHTLHDRGISKIGGFDGRGSSYLGGGEEGHYIGEDHSSWGIPPSTSPQLSPSPLTADVPVRKTVAERYTSEYGENNRKSMAGIIESGPGNNVNRSSRAVSFGEYDKMAGGEREWDRSGEEERSRPGSSLSMNGAGGVGGSILNRGRPKSPFELDQASSGRMTRPGVRSRVVSFEGDLGVIGEELLRSVRAGGGGDEEEMLTGVEEVEVVERRIAESQGVGFMSRGRPKSPFEEDHLGGARRLMDRDRTRTKSLDVTSAMADGAPASYFPDYQQHRSTSTQDNRPSSSLGLASRVPLPPSPGPNSLSFPPSSQSPGTTDQEDLPNPFALPAPAGDRLSRFDPKAAAESRRHSMVSVSALATGSGSETMGGRTRQNSRFSSGGITPADVEAYRQAEGRGIGGDKDVYRNSTMSYAEMNNQPQDGYISARISRPKTLIMPSPLQGVMNAAQSSPSKIAAERRGFTMGVKPLPIGAIGREDSFVESLPSSGSGMSLSQKLFSDQLEVGGVRGKGFIGGAERDGEEGVHTFGGYETRYVEEVDEDYGMGEQPGQEEDWRPTTRTLTGPSLMDRIEARKAAMKGKQRVFTGDARPAMMARQSSKASQKEDNRASWVPVVIPDISGLSPQAGGGSRRSGQPLMAFPSSENLPLDGGRPGMAKTRSVFGVDNVWNRELEILRKAEEAEQLAAAQEDRDHRDKQGKKKKGRKGASKTPQIDIEELHHQTEAMTDYFGTNPAPTSGPANEEGAHEEGPMTTPQPRQPHPSVPVEEWYASSSEDGSEDNNDETTPKRRKAKAQAKGRVVSAAPALSRPTAGIEESSDDEEDVPLSKAFAVNAGGRFAGTRSVSMPMRKMDGEKDESSEEDEPLSKIRAKASTNHIHSPSRMQPINSLTSSTSDQDDDIPLALKRAHIQSAEDEDEDDQPLGARHASGGMAQQQQRMSMMQMQQQQQQQQQDFYRHSMMSMMPFPSPMMGGMGMGMPGMPGMFAPPAGHPTGMFPFQPPIMPPMHTGMSMPGMGMPMSMSMPMGMGMGIGPPPVDPSIDRWRREVVEREGSVVGGSGSGGAGTRSVSAASVSG